MAEPSGVAATPTPTPTMWGAVGALCPMQFVDGNTLHGEE
jgi:hypothetical protein